MSGRRQLVAISAARRERACRRVGLVVSRRIGAASVVAVVDAAADALAEGRIGTARDLMSAVCPPARAERILFELLGDDEPTPPPTAPREAVG